MYAVFTHHDPMNECIFRFVWKTQTEIGIFLSDDSTHTSRYEDKFQYHSPVHMIIFPDVFSLCLMLLVIYNYITYLFFSVV